jgi:hypothetical protein
MMHFSKKSPVWVAPARLSGPDGGKPIALPETTPRPMDRRLETAGEIEMAMRMKRVLYSVSAIPSFFGIKESAGLDFFTPIQQ